MATAALKPRRRWLRYSLRTLLLLVTVLCVWLGLKVNAARRQREAVAAIRLAHGSVVYDYQLVHAPGQPNYETYDEKAEPTAPLWLRRIFGDDFFQDVVEANFDKDSQTTTAEDFAQLASLPGLRTVHLDAQEVFTDGEHLPRPIIDADLACFDSLCNLRNVGLGYAHVEGPGLAHLMNSKRLQHLFLEETRVGDSGMKFIGGMTDLESLDLSGTRVTDAGLEQLRALSNLESLRLARTNITDAGFAYMNSTKLQFLELYNTKIGDASMKRIGGLVGLNYLNLGGVRITDSGMKHLENLTNLENLTLEGPQISDGGFRYVNSMNLRMLALPFTHVGDASMERIGRMSRLMDLFLRGTQVSDAGFEQLQNLGNLTSLVLSDTNVSDAAIPHLRMLTKLNRLHVVRTRVTAEGARQLKQALPAATIYQDSRYDW